MLELVLKLCGVMVAFFIIFTLIWNWHTAIIIIGVILLILGIVAAGIQFLFIR